MAQPKLYDALVVGSGASGGWVAKILTEQGLEVLVLEAGPPRSPTRDFTEHVWPYRMRYRGFGDQKALLRDRSEEHTSELQSLRHLVCRLLLEKKNTITFSHGGWTSPRALTPPSPQQAVRTGISHPLARTSTPPSTTSSVFF